MFKQLIRQFHFTKTERYGATALLFLSGVVFAIPAVLRFVHQPDETDFSAFEKQIQSYQPVSVAEASHLEEKTGALFPFDPNTASPEILVQLGVPEKVARTIEKYRERGGRFRTADDLGKIYTLPEEVFERLRPFVRIGGNRAPAKTRQADIARAEPFSFDPNTATEENLLRLGLPKALVGRLLRYREKGGFFFEKADFRKLYGMTDTDFARLEPYIAIARSEAAVRPAAYAGGAGSAPTAISNLDINTASVEAWKRLPGIAGRANQIVRFRDKLGGFVRPEQVGETFGLPDSVYQAIRGYLEVASPVFKKINLNSATEDELNAHPYISFKQAKLIVAYREQHGPFGSVEELKRIAAFTDRGWLEKVFPYVVAN